MAFTTTLAQNILQFYCDEYSFRWNTRDMTDGERFEAWFDNIGGKRLMYTALIQKNKESEQA